uniref:Uncharacterized protein n=1 Tax=Anguilla anguilla TaxID=7936 RepID=A0A0E9PQZ9_ANGAN
MLNFYDPEVSLLIKQSLEQHRYLIEMYITL